MIGLSIVPVRRVLVSFPSTHKGEPLSGKCVFYRLAYDRSTSEIHLRLLDQPVIKGGGRLNVVPSIWSRRLKQLADSPIANAILNAIFGQPSSPSLVSIVGRHVRVICSGLPQALELMDSIERSLASAKGQLEFVRHEPRQSFDRPHPRVPRPVRVAYSRS
jgi:hypothetical protein